MSESKPPMRISPHVRRRLLRSIRALGGRVSPRDVQRKGIGCRTAAEAQAKLQLLVDARVGCWLFTTPGRRGGRPRRLFVLNSPSRRATAGADRSALHREIRWAAAYCYEAQQLARDIGELIEEHLRLDAGLCREEILSVPRHLSDHLRGALMSKPRQRPSPSRPNLESRGSC